jgi:hypothetical protein
VTARQALVRTAHFLTGSAVFAMSVVITLQAHRQMALGIEVAPAPVSRTQGAA